MARELALKKSLDGVERWFDEKGPGGRSFRESLAAGGVIAEDLLVVAGAVTGMLNSGLTREALLLLIQAKCPRPHGRPMPITTISDVIEAMASLDTFIEAKR
jgi:hypothetical protein